MLWVKIKSRTGEIISPPLVYLEDHRLLCQLSLITTVPRGAFVTGADIYHADHVNEQNTGDIVFNRDDMYGAENTGAWTGCCGPSGDSPNLETEEGIPIAYESADCMDSHHVSIPFDWHEKIPVAELANQSPVILFGVVDFHQRPHILERAVGPTRKSAEFRLKQAAKGNIGHWIRKPGPARALFEKMEICDLCDAEGLIKQGDRAWYTRKPF